MVFFILYLIINYKKKHLDGHRTTPEHLPGGAWPAAEQSYIWQQLVSFRFDHVGNFHIW